MKPLLMIEDDRRLANMVKSYLETHGFSVAHAETAADGWSKLDVLTVSNEVHEAQYGVIILDLMLPDGDGLELCQRIRNSQRAFAQAPILMLTAKGDPIDRVLGLEIGADDYLAKPFEPRELLARIRALIRRAQVTPMPTASNANQLQIGDLHIDLDGRRLYVDKAEKKLTAYQFDILALLAKNAGKILSRDQLLEHLKGHNANAFDRSIDVHIGRIRMAIEKDHRNPQRIITVRGSGYSMVRA